MRPKLDWTPRPNGRLWIRDNCGCVEMNKKPTKLTAKFATPPSRSHCPAGKLGRLSEAQRQRTVR